MPMLERDGTAIYFEATGSGPAILLSHGYSATSHMWQDQVNHLKDRFTVITWDIRGHGRSDSPPQAQAYSESCCLADMNALLDQAGAKQAVVGGLSLGGYLSLSFQLAHPERVAGLMLFDTGPGYRDDAAREEWNTMARARGRKFRKRGLAELSGDEPDADTRVHGGQHTSAEGLALAAEGILTQSTGHVMAGLGAIDTPTLVLVGALDTPFLGASSYMARKMPNAELVTLEQAGHAANLDQPAAFNHAVDTFLAELTDGVPSW